MDENKGTAAPSTLIPVWKPEWPATSLPTPAPQPEAKAEEKPALLDLSSAERVVRLKIGSRKAHHIFRALTLDDWARYTKRARIALVQDEGAIATESAEDEAAIELWDKAIVRVEGYKLPGCSGDVSSPNGEHSSPLQVKEVMPATHKITAVAALQEVYEMPIEDPLDLTGGQVTIRIEAAWNLAVYENLLHCFRRPGQAETLEYRRMMAESYRQRPRERGGPVRILLPTHFKELCALYDKLIDWTEGYLIGDVSSPIGEHSSPLQQMDALHKQTAVIALFAPPETGGPQRHRDTEKND